MAAFSLFRGTNMAVVTSCENREFSQFTSSSSAGRAEPLHLFIEPIVLWRSRSRRRRHLS